MPPDPRFERLLKLLNAGTVNRRLSWSQTPDEDTFRITFGTGIVRVGKSPHLINGQQAYTLVVLDQSNQVIEEIRPANEEENALLEQIYSNARRSALNLDFALNALLEELENRAGVSSSP